MERIKEDPNHLSNFELDSCLYRWLEVLVTQELVLMRNLVPCMGETCWCQQVGPQANSWLADRSELMVCRLSEPQAVEVHRHHAGSFMTRDGITAVCKSCSGWTRFFSLSGQWLGLPSYSLACSLRLIKGHCRPPGFVSHCCCAKVPRGIRGLKQALRG